MEQSKNVKICELPIKDLRKKYPPPLLGKEFADYWFKYVRATADHPSFGIHQLKNIEILCCLYLEYDRMSYELDQFYEENKKYSVVSHGRYGEQHRSHPIIGERKGVLGEIRQFTKMMAIELKPLKFDQPEDEPEESDWNKN